MTDRIHRFGALDSFRDYGDDASGAGRRRARLRDRIGERPAA